MTLESQNYVGFFRRLIAGIIDFTILLTTSIVIGMAANSYFDGIINKEVMQLSKLTRADVNKRYADVYGLPKDQIEKLDHVIILSTEYYGLENDRLNNNLAGSTNEFDIFDNTKAVERTLMPTDFKLAFPINTDQQTISREQDKFLKQYANLIDAGNPIDRFRKAYPEFNHIGNTELAETIWHSFFPGYKESYEFNGVFGTYGGKIKAESYSFYVDILILAYIVSYFSLSLSSKFSATFGKMALGIKVLNADGTKLTLRKSIVYTICFLVFSIGTFFTTFLPVFFNKNRQALHDRVCKVMLTYN